MIWFSAEITTPFIGVSLNVLIAAAVGAYCSFSFGETIQPRSRMFRLFTTAVLLGSLLSAIIVATLTLTLPGLVQTEALKVGIAGVVSFLVPHVVPDFIKRVRELISEFMRKEKK